MHFRFQRTAARPAVRTHFCSQCSAASPPASFKRCCSKKPAHDKKQDHRFKKLRRHEDPLKHFKCPCVLVLHRRRKLFEQHLRKADVMLEHHGYSRPDLNNIKCIFPVIRILRSHATPQLSALPTVSDNTARHRGSASLQGLP